MRNTIILVLLLSMTISCQAQVPNQLSPVAFKSQIEKEDDAFKILDLRTDKEVSEGMVPGAEQLDFLADDFDSKLSELNKSTTYYIYCRSGGRSGRALTQMTELGFEKVYEMQGGMNAWKSAGLETE
ncbi:MAG: rhodanese-like domain-containing protein [Reichenbachiella sp.]|uniref:rhodanese-like domain-containing protein n=1 Tax=Reichenbachiella sp. TaxID=2184521 RepID=UPI002966F4A2|nr:rhodanese-like domain-containing protein [Reichenbachiella sp.]MDW3210907.1 rhodanese-like domain-containing protein [Reichenbachiella sp.]